MNQAQYYNRSEKYHKLARYYRLKAVVFYKCQDYDEAINYERFAQNMDENEIYWMNRAKNYNS